MTEWWEYLLVGVLAVMLLFCFWALFILLPVAMHADQKCLSQGYPKSSVTWNLEIYCMTLDGAVTVKVNKQ